MSTSSKNEHGKLITAAAKAALLPLGCIRKGQSRVWYSDQRFWAIVIEFQPSGWSKGSYLNISRKYLWRLGPGSTGSYRPVDFIPFESLEQFTPLIANMANVAAREVIDIAERLKRPENIHTDFLTEPLRDGWPVYDATISSWLMGDFELTTKLLRRMADWPTYGYDWQFRLKDHSASFAAKLKRPADCFAHILDTIQQSRKLISLPPDNHCLDDFPAARAARKQTEG